MQEGTVDLQHGTGVDEDLHPCIQVPIAKFGKICSLPKKTALKNLLTVFFHH
jgi:hypothetical protein